MRTLETERLLLRDWNETDIGRCSLYDENTIRYLLSAQNNYAVILKNSGEIIGSIGLNEDGEHNEQRRNIGIVLLEQYWNKGIMSEALAATIHMAHEITPCLSYMHIVGDLRSKHIAEKFEFKYIKTICSEDGCEKFMYYILETGGTLAHDKSSFVELNCER